MASAQTLEDENDLRHFLKVARPQWSKPRQGPNDLSRVMAKLREIGVTDTETLVHRVHKNTLNDELAAKRHVRLSREAIESIRRHGPFVRALECVDAPHIRQTGAYAPVPQLLSRKRVADSLAPPPRGAGKAKSSSSTSSHLGKSCSTPGALGLAATHSEGFGLSDRGGSCSASEAPQDGAGNDDVHCALPVRLRGANARSRQQVSRLRLAEGEGVRKESSLDDSASAASEPESRESRLPSPRPTAPSSPQGAGGSWPAIPSSATSSCSPRHAGKIATAPSPACSFPRLATQSPAPTAPQADAEPVALPPTRASLKAVASAKVFSKRLSNAVHGEGHLPQLSDVSVDEVARLRRVGATMGSSKREARWSNTGAKAPLSLGEEMLCEQEALDERAGLLRQASDDVTMRMHIAGNIRSRLKQEMKAQGQEALNMQQKCLNIKKNLADMTSFRRELSGLKAQVELLNWEAHKSDDSLKDLGSCFTRHKRHSLTPVGSTQVAGASEEALLPL